MGIYEDIKALMAEAEAAHREVDRRYDAKLQALVDARAHPAVVAPPVAPAETAEKKGRARSGAVRDAIRIAMADGERHKLADLVRTTGMARGSIFNALARMIERGEAVSHGDGIYQLTVNESPGGVQPANLLA